MSKEKNNYYSSGVLRDTISLTNQQQTKKHKRGLWRFRRSKRMASSQQSSSSNKNFCLYKKEPSTTIDERKEGEENELVVSVVATDLDGDKESALRKYVVQKASKNMIYKSGTINVIPRGSVSPSKGPTSQLVGFIALLELAGEHLDEALQEETATEESTPPTPNLSREYYICFLCEADNDHSLSLFHAELRSFTEQLVPILQRHSDSSAEKLAKSITLIASSWDWHCVEYITRCVKLLDTQLDKVIHAILIGKQVVIAAPQPVFDDLAKLLLVVSIVNLSPALRGGVEDEGDEPLAQAAGSSGTPEDATRLLISCTTAPLTTFIPPPSPPQETTSPASSPPSSAPSSPTLPRETSTPYIPRAGDYGDVQVTLNTKDTNSFCTSWAGQLRDGTSDPFKLRTLLEDLKLKVIQELNFIRKVIDQAKLSNYQLYKSYLMLRANSNCDVLLSLLLKDITNDATTSEVLEVIHEYMLEDTERPMR